MFKIFNLEGLFLSKAKKIISALLAVAMLMTAAPVSMFASAYDPSVNTSDLSTTWVDPVLHDQYYYVDTTATTDVIRVANANNPFTLGTTIVRATESGIPYSTGDHVNAAYAEETPAYPKIVVKFVGRQPTEVSTPSAAGGINSYTIDSTATESTETIDGKTAYVYTFNLTAGVGTAGQPVTYSIKYKMDGKEYTAYAYAKVEDVLIQSGYVRHQLEKASLWYPQSRTVFVVTLQGKNVYSEGFCDNATTDGLSRGYINFKTGTYDDGGKALLGVGSSSESFSDSATAFAALYGGKVDGGTQKATMVKWLSSHAPAGSKRVRASLFGRDKNRPLSTQYIDLRNETISSLNLREMIMLGDVADITEGGLTDYKVRLYDEAGGAVGSYSSSNSTYWNTGTQPNTSYFNVSDWGDFATDTTPLTPSSSGKAGDFAIVRFGGSPALDKAATSDTYTYAFSNYHYGINGNDDNFEAFGESGIAINFKVYNTVDLYNVYMGILKGTGSYTTTYMQCMTGSTYSNQTVTFNKGPNPRSDMYSGGWNEFLSAFHAAGQLLQNPKTDQATINSTTNNLIDKYNKLVKNFYDSYTVNVYHYEINTTTEVAPPQSWAGVPYNTKATLYPCKNLKAYTVHDGNDKKDVVVNDSTQTVNYYFYYDPVTFSIQAVTNTNDKDGNPIQPMVGFGYGATVNTSESFDGLLGTKEFYTFEGDLDSTVTGWYYDEDFTQPVPETFTMEALSKTIYAKWETTPLHIYLDTQIEGKDVIDLGSIQPNDDAEIKTPFARPADDPSVEGYLFVEYYADPELTTLVSWPQYFYLGETDRTIYGRFEDVNGKIVFESNGGSKVEDQPFTAGGDPITAPADPTREGYTFGGWYYDRDCTAGQEVEWDRVMPNNTGFIAYAKWNPERHKISFNLNNSTKTEFDTQDIHYIEGYSDSEILTEDIPNPPRRFGYVFSHWVYDGKQYNFEKYPTKDITVIAVWRAVDTSAFIGLKAYEKLSGSYGDPITVAQHGDIVTVQMTSLANFYTGSSLFVFMYDSNFFELIGNGATAFKLNSENEYVAGIDASFTAVTNSSSLRWPSDYDDNFKNQYSAMQIAIDPQISEDNFTTAPMQDGKWLVEFQLKVRDDATGTGKVFMENTWTRSGSNIMGTMFYGWSESESPVFNTTNDKVTPDLTNAVVEISLDSTPVQQSTVNLDANYFEKTDVNPGKFEATGLSTASYTGPAETEIIGYVSPVRTGYKLTGWINTDSTVTDYTEWGENSSAEGYYVPYAHTGTTFGAEWTPIDYTISFYSDTEGGSIVTDGSVITAYDAQIVPPADPTREGYDFAGWVDADGNAVTTFPICKGDDAYYATWTPATDTEYKIVTHYTFEASGTEYYPEIILTGTTGAKVVLVDDATMPATPEEGVTYININDLLTMKDESGKNLANANIVNGNFIFDTEDGRNALPKEGTIQPDGSLTFDLYYVGRDVTVIFDAGGGTFTLTAEDGTTSTATQITSIAHYRAKLVAPSEPLERYGYTFNKWSPEIRDNTFYNRDTTYTATWTPISTNVQFMTYDGSAQIGELVATNFGSVPTAPTAPERAGYNFIGWATTANATSALTTLPAVDALNDETTGIAKTYYAYYELANVDVTYKVDGVVKYTDTYKMGDNVTIRPVETKTGYNFSGWKINGAAATDFVMGTDPVTIEGTFTAKTIGVTFNANGGKYSDNNTTKTVDSTFDGAINLPEEPTKAGYTFNGWATEASATEGEFELGTLTAESATYYATWAPNTNVQYYIDIYVMDTNGAYPENPTETLSNGLTGTVDQFVDEYVPENRTGFTVTGDSVLTGKIPAEGELRLVVKYERNQYNLIVKLDGVVKSTTTYYYDEAVSEPAKPTKEGYHFVGWTPAIPEKMPAEDKEIEAQMEPDQYTIAFNTDGGSAISSYSQAYGTVISEPPVPTKTGYTFDYWVVEGSTEKVVFSDTTPTVPLNGVTFKAIYKTNDYNIVYMNGADIVKTVAVPYGTTKADIQANYAPAENEEPTAEGKIFLDWNWAALPDTMPANEVRLQASWQNKTYTITFDEKGGSAVSDITAEYDSAIRWYDTTELEGYKFEYWYYDDENTEYVIPSNMPALDLIEADGSIELKAKWTVKSYTITFNEVGGDAVADITADYNAPITIPTPIKTGYTFDYWYYDDASTEYEIGNTMPALDLIEDDGSIELTAHWTVKSITITFDANGGDAVAPITQNYNTYISDKPVATRKGYTFNGWLLDGQAYTIPDYMPAESITLVADWTINTYKINFTDTGNSTVDSIEAAFGAPIKAPENPTKTGYNFNYWYYNDPATPYVIGDTMPALDTELGITTKEITLTAKWSINQYTITFDTDGGSTVNPITQNYGTNITKPANPTKEGYTFAGWDTPIPDKMPEGNMIIKATWTPVRYTITFDEAGGSEVTDISADYKTSISKPADPTREGYTFEYWYEAATPDTAFVFDTMPLNGAKLIAKWTIVQYTITIDAVGGTYEDGTAINNITLDYDAPITNAPEHPVKSGYTFDNWYTTDSEGNEVVYTFPANMPAKNVSIVAKWTIVAYEVIFYNYDGSVYYDYDGTKLDYQTPIDAAPAGEPAREHYIFLGWSQTENPDPETETAINFETAGIKVPVDGLKFYPIFERVAVTLDLIDENAKVTTEGAVDPITGYIYGIATKTNEDTLRSQYLAVKGDGRLEITLTKYNLCGTGARVDVWDNVEDKIVETYYIVIFGDVNGDSGVDMIDVSMLLNEVAGNTKWSKETYLDEANADFAYYRVLAADLNGDGTVTNNDYGCLRSVTLYAAEINQEVDYTTDSKMVYYS